jgi:hypothetical protein
MRVCPFPKKHAAHQGKDSIPFATVFLGGKQSAISPLNADQVLPEYIPISGERISLALTQLLTWNR